MLKTIFKPRKAAIAYQLSNVVAWRFASTSSNQIFAAQTSPQPVISSSSGSKLKSLRDGDILPFSAFLTDTFGRKHTYLRISVTERCNLRCLYCMPEEGVPLTPTAKLLSDEEIVRIVQLFINQGVTKIRFTGGEPLIRKELTSIIGQLSGNKLKAIGITTNGILLQRYLSDLVTNGLTHINISLDSLNPTLFEKLSRRPSTAWFKVWKSIEMAQEVTLKALKLNMVVMKGVNDHEVPDFVELTKDRNLDIRFIEYMPFTGNKWDLDKMVPYKDLLSKIQLKHSTINKLEDSVNHTAKAYQIPGYRGKFGFITSMSEHFCGGCNRLRITADGNLKVCLFGNTEVSLRDVMRGGATDDELLELIGGGVKRKHAKHAGMMNLSKMENRPMILIDWMDNIMPRDMSRNYLQTFNILQIPNYSNGLHNLRHYSTLNSKYNEGLSHVDTEGRAKMVDVSGKVATTREAIAIGTVVLNAETFQAVLENNVKKGDVLTVSQIAGILGGKETSNLIPLCHPLPLAKLDVTLKLDSSNNSIQIQSIAKTTANTGVEMEALTAVAIAALTIYDMCKALDKGIIIKEIKLLKKTGGKSDYQAK